MTKSEYLQKKLDELEVSNNETISLIVKCFTASPIACDGVLLVSADNYNNLVKHLNKK